MSRVKRITRTDGRRKGYTAHKSSVASRMHGSTLRKLEAMRGPVKAERDKGR